MQIISRGYNRATDFGRVGRFLVRTYGLKSRHVNWPQPRWEYMHYHPLVRGVDLSAIGIWEAQGEIVGVVHPEHNVGTVFLEVDPEHDALKVAMLTYGEKHLRSASDGMNRLRVYINDQDEGFQRAVAEMGYRKGGGCEPTSHMAIPNPFPRIALPAGFRLRSLADENDLRKVHRVLWRGFNHGDEPPEDGIRDQEFMQSAPNFRKDLNIVVEAPDGTLTAYCGMWYEGVHAVAYVEPVATDPEYRRMGLGRAAVMEGVRRCGILGASVAWVGSAEPFYLSLGFRQVQSCCAWGREWTE
jgi:predicted N-acetyltransferase YhbS